MRDHAELLGPVLTTFNDYVGTAAADEGTRLPANQLYEASGLDRDRWWIVAVDISFDSRADHSTYYAFDQSRHPIDSHAELLEVLNDEGQIPVTAFQAEPEDITPSHIRAALPSISLRLIARAVQDTPVTVTAHHHLKPPSTS